MEKGSFHTSVMQDQDFVESSHATATTQELVRRIPLPNEVPRGLNFKDIPPGAIKSATLENLISQNEDLMARLSVSLRSANHSEEKIALLERENTNLKAKLSMVQEQFSVLTEKDKILAVRSQKLLEDNTHIRDHQHKLEKAYSDLYVQATSFQRRLQYLERYRVRVKKASASVQARAKSLAQILPSRDAEIAELKESLRSAHAQAEAELLQARQSLAQSNLQMVKSYEAKLADCQREILELQAKANERDEVFDEKVRMENQLVFEQRQHANLREDSGKIIDRLQNETSDLRVQLKASLVKQEAQRVEIDELSSAVPALKDQTKAQQEQVESLQALWGHKQREFEQLDEKNKALQKLNQSLSVTLNQQRKDMQTLQAEMDAERFEAGDRIKILTQEIEMLRSTEKD